MFALPDARAVACFTARGRSHAAEFLLRSVPAPAHAALGVLSRAAGLRRCDGAAGLGAARRRLGCGARAVVRDAARAVGDAGSLARLVERGLPHDGAVAVAARPVRGADHGVAAGWIAGPILGGGCGHASVAGAGADRPVEHAQRGSVDDRKAPAELGCRQRRGRFVGWVLSGGERLAARTGSLHDETIRSARAGSLGAAALCDHRATAGGPARAGPVAGQAARAVSARLAASAHGAGGALRVLDDRALVFS